MIVLHVTFSPWEEGIFRLAVFASAVRTVMRAQFLGRRECAEGRPWLVFFGEQLVEVRMRHFRLPSVGGTIVQHWMSSITVVFATKA